MFERMPGGPSPEEMGIPQKALGAEPTDMSGAYAPVLEDHTVPIEITEKVSAPKDSIAPAYFSQAFFPKESEERAHVFGPNDTRISSQVDRPILPHFGEAKSVSFPSVEVKIGKILGRGGQGTVYEASPVWPDHSLSMVLAVSRSLHAESEQIDQEDEAYSNAPFRYIVKVVKAGNIRGEEILVRQKLFQLATQERERQQRLGILLDVKTMQDEKGNVFHVMLMEREPGKTLLHVKEEQAQKPDQLESVDSYIRFVAAMKAIAKKLHAREEQGWVHCDIKPANLMIDMDYPFMSTPIDFGIAQTKEEMHKRDGYAGTPRYMITNESETAGQGGSEAWRDIYALALSFAETIGLMRIRDEGKNAFQTMMAQHMGELIESPRLGKKRIGSPVTENNFSTRTATIDTYSNLLKVETKSAGQQAFIALLYRIVQPHDIASHRQQNWQTFTAKEEPLSWKVVEEELDQILQQLAGEALAENGEPPLTKEELDTMRCEIEARVGRAKNRMYAQWRMMSHEQRQSERGKEIERAMKCIRNEQDIVTQLQNSQEVLRMIGEMKKGR